MWTLPESSEAMVASEIREVAQAGIDSCYPRQNPQS